MKVQLPAEIISQIQEKIYDFPPKSVFLFGSRVKGKSTSVSDVDIGIFTEKGISPAEFQSFKDFLLSLPLLQKIDLVDFRYTTKEFQSLALKNAYFLN